MERLTDINLNVLGNPRYRKCITAECDYDCGSCVFQHEADRKLKEYEDLEEQGLLPRFHLGGDFWTIRLGKVLKAKVVMLQQKKDGSWQYRFSREITPEYHDTHNYKESEFGKRFFLTKEEAEQALERMEKEKE